MEEIIYAQTREAIRKNGGRKDPVEVAAILGIEHIPLYGSIAGYATYYNKGFPIKVIAIKKFKDHVMWQFGGFHEIKHVLSGDIYDESLLVSGMVADSAFLQHGIDSIRIPSHERSADIFSAEIILEDRDVEAVTGCNQPLIIEYREARKSIQETWEKIQRLRQVAQRDSFNELLIARLKEYECRLRRDKDAIADIEYQIMDSAYCKTAKDAACELGTNETILGFKIEGMRQRGLDIPQFADSTQLDYRNVFKNALAHCRRELL